MFHDKPLVQHNSFASNSFVPFHRFMAPPERIRVAKNINSPNECARFEKSDDMWPKTTDAMAGIRAQKCPSAGITLQASALRVTYIISSAAPQSNEIRGSEENSLNFMTKRFTSVSFSWNFQKSMFHEKPLVHHNSFASNSFAPFHRSMAPPERIRVAKNTGSPNERARFEKSGVMWPKNTDSMSGIRSQNCPRSGITLQASALRVMCKSKRDAAEQWNSRQRRKIIEFHAQTAHQRQLFMKYWRCWRLKMQFSMNFIRWREFIALRRRACSYTWLVER